MKRPAFITALISLAAATMCLAQTPAAAMSVPKKPGFTMADLKAQVPQNKEGTFLMEVPAILNTSTDREVQGLLTGQAVETTGQIVAETTGNADAKSLRITRSQLQCCSAHARQCSIALQFTAKAPAFKEFAWVTLTGTVSYRQEDGKAVPVISVKEIREIPKPANALLQ
jgi:hypothetical protein